MLLTLRLAAATTVLLLLIALPLAWWITRREDLLRALVQAAVALPLVLPPTVIGYYLLVGFGPLTAVGRAITSLLGHTLAFSFAGLLAGSVIYSLPFAVQPLVAGFRSLDPGFAEAATMLGRSPVRVFWEVVLPMSRASLITAAVLTFSHTVGEFGVVLMLGGNIPGVTRTLSIQLYDQVQDGSYAAANLTALSLAGLSAVALVAIYLRPASWRGGRAAHG